MVFVLLGKILNVPVNSYGHVRKVSSINHTFSGQYFMQIFSIVTDNNPS